MAFAYKEEKNRETWARVDEMLADLPGFCKTYVRAREGRVSALTMLAYMQRVRKFFEYLHDNNRYFGSRDISAYTLDDLAKLETEDIEDFAHWIRTGASSEVSLPSGGPVSGGNGSAAGESDSRGSSGASPGKASSADGRRKKNRRSGNVRQNKESSVNNYLSALNSLYAHFCRKGRIPSNPVANVERGKKGPHEIIRLNDDQEQAFLSAAAFGTGLSDRQLAYQQKTDIRDTAICLLLSRTGIRVSELVGLNVDDVDFKAHSIRVLRKRNKPDIVFFDDEVSEWLTEYLEVRGVMNPDPEEKAFFLVSMKGKSYGKRLSVRSVQMLVKKYAVAGSPLTGNRITPHKLRATYATNMLKETENLALVQAELNHESPTTTMMYADKSVMDTEAARNTLMKRKRST